VRSDCNWRELACSSLSFGTLAGRLSLATGHAPAEGLFPPKQFRCLSGSRAAAWPAGPRPKTRQGVHRRPEPTVTHPGCETPPSGIVPQARWTPELERQTAVDCSAHRLGDARTLAPLEGRVGMTCSTRGPLALAVLLLWHGLQRTA
jgi:hypothetical protein